MQVKRDIKNTKHAIKITLIILTVAGIIAITWLVGRYGMSSCGEDKGSIYQPALCFNKSK